MAEITTSRVAPPGVPWRAIGALALIALLIAAAVAVYVGSRPRLPAPFGPAADGQLVWAADGDIYASASLSGTPRVIVGGPEVDSKVTLSRDGTSMAFLRQAKGGVDVIVAPITGSEPRRVTKGPLREVERLVWSPDGRTIAVDDTVDGKRVITIIAADGSDSYDLATDDIDASSPDWRPPDGKELLFRGERDGQVDLYLVRPDGSGLRPMGVRLDPFNVSESLLRPVWSPDGVHIAYHSSDQLDGGAAQRWQTHVLDVRTDRDIVISPASLPSQHDTEPMWSPDGTRVVTQRFVYGSADWMAVTAIDGSSSVDTDARSPFSSGGWNGQFSPDGATVIGYHSDTHETLAFDATTGRSTHLGWPVTEPPTWQRLAPD